MNEFLFFFTIALVFLGIVVFYRLWGKAGLFSWVALASIITNIEVLKCVDVFNISMTLGTALYGANFLATDMLSEFYGGKTARKAVMVGFGAVIALTIFSQICLLFTPNEVDWASPALKEIFGFAPRVCFASLFAYFISNNIDTFLYDWIGKRTDKIWVKNNCSTLTSQAIHSILFCILAFAGTMPLGALLEIILSTYLVKIVVAVLDTPIMYLAKGIYEKNFKGKTIEE